MESILRYSDTKRKSTASSKRESVHITSEAVVCDEGVSDMIAPTAGSGTGPTASSEAAPVAPSGSGPTAETSVGDAPTGSFEPVKSAVLLAPSEYREGMR